MKARLGSALQARKHDGAVHSGMRRKRRLHENDKKQRRFDALSEQKNPKKIEKQKIEKKIEDDILLLLLIRRNANAGLKTCALREQASDAAKRIYLRSPRTDRDAHWAALATHTCLCAFQCARWQSTEQ